MKENIFKRFKQDHQVLKKALAENIEQPIASSADIEQICQTYMNHLEQEERLFYPLFQEKDLMPSMVQETELEHRETKQLIAMILQGHIDGFTGKENLELLQLNLEQHMITSEHELFPALKKRLSHGELEQMSHQEEYPATPVKPDHHWYDRLFTH